MQANEKYSIRVGSMLSDGKDKVYQVTYFVFTEGITSKYGTPVEDNIVHVDIYDANNLEQPIEHKDFIHLNFVEPLPIKKEYLDKVGFKDSKLNGQKVYLCNDTYFESLTPAIGVYTIRRISNNEHFAVQYVHQVQIIAANEK